MKFGTYKIKNVFPTNFVLGIVLTVKENNHISPRIFAKRGSNIMTFDKYDDYNVISHRLGYPLIAVYMTNVDVESDIEIESDCDIDKEIITENIGPGPIPNIRPM